MAKFIGLMSGTSMDGIDVALIDTDGADMMAPGPGFTVAYPEGFRQRLAAAVAACWRAGPGGLDPAAHGALEESLTQYHAKAVARLLDETGLAARDIAAIGFHGHTMLHCPERGFTWQMGDGARLARLTGVSVIGDFRRADLAAGGQGAPLAPVFHHAMVRAAGLAPPVMVVNLGGVGNVSWIGPEGALLAFDSGPGNALIDEWAQRHLGRPCDKDGALAAAGRVDEAVLAQLGGHEYFLRKPPKSLDRNSFSIDPVDSLSPADGAATLAAFTAFAVAKALDHLPVRPRLCLVSGGGRLNPVLMAMLGARLGVPVRPIEAIGFAGDLVEAHLFGYLAARVIAGLPFSFPGTTGVKRPQGAARRFSP
ncbi:MAG: anhydro-N-acetylmuramic acid kinase [Pseudomonadota bacterium]